MKKISLSSTTSPAKETQSVDRAESSLHASFLSLPLHEESSGENNFIQATRQGFYTYWLTLADVIDIARVEYNSFKSFKSVSGSLNSDFQTLDSLSHLIDKITRFQTQAKQLGSARMTLIINTGYARWTIIVLSYHENYEKNFKSIYVNSINRRLKSKIQDFFHTQKVLFYDLSPYLYERMDTYDVGLWALEIAADLNKMLDENYDLAHMVIDFARLSRQRDTHYFKQKRKALADKLSSDSKSIIRVKPSTSDLRVVPSSSALLVAVDEPALKRMKIESKKETIELRLEVFAKTFIKTIGKLLGLYHVIAKGDRLTTENLITELRTGATGALLGATIAQGIAGSVPSLVATVRSISSHYYFSGDKACKITKAFEQISSGKLSPLLGIVAVDIFYSYESQFMSVTDKAGNKMAMEKLAEDAAARSLNYIGKTASSDQTRLITRDLLSEGVFLGKSEKYFAPSIKPLKITMIGTEILHENGEKMSTANLYTKVGIRIFNTETHEVSFYQLKKLPDKFNSFIYGYRRLLNWEKQENGEPKEFFLNDYQQSIPTNPENQTDSVLQNYEYYLDENKLEESANFILEKINQIPSIQSLINLNPKTPIYFNLRKTVNHFTGRKEVLNKLHELLMADRHIAVVTQDLALLSLNLDKPSSSTANTVQISLSGLGGVGKTQVALRYAELYASSYDNNIIWINAETKNDIINSFVQLAPLLNISNKNGFGYDKTIDELLSDIYDYFKDRKSLFIFDNVENYREFEQFLSIKQTGNAPTFLITSRFSHWNNILPVLTLDVFTHLEAIEFVKNKLNILTDEHNPKIIELINLLHRLPLALQQAVTYIDMQQYVNSTFSVEHYIEIFKEKSEEVLQFEFTEYSNDPYLKSVFIVWSITLDKIKNNKDFGEKALEILNIMAYLYPDHITNNLFSCLENPEKLSPAIHLLQSYSIISMGNQPDISVIHRLVQKVVRINLEKDFKALEENTANIFKVTQNFHKVFELSVHYIYFILYMRQNSKLSHRLKLGITKSRIMDLLVISGEQIISAHLYDAARLILTKEQYFNFLGNALFFYIKEGLLSFVMETISYIEKNLEEGLLKKSDIKIILDYRYKAADEELANWLVSDPDGKKRQIDGVRLVSDFENKIFFKKASSCRFKKRRRRDVSCLSETFNRQTHTSLVQSHLKFVAHCVHLISLEKMKSQISLPSFLREEWGRVALHFGKLIESGLLTKVSDIKLSEELAFLTEKEFLDKHLLLNRTEIFDIFQNKFSALNKKKNLLKHAMKLAKPFTKLSRFSIENSVNFEKEIKDYYQLKNLKALKDGSSSLNVLADTVIPDQDQSYIGVAKKAAEFFNVLEDLAEPEEFLSEETIKMGIWLTNKTVQAIRQVNQIEQYVHLDMQEELREDLRAFMNLTPSSYLIAKAANTRLVKEVLIFLKKHTSIQRYIFPAVSSSSTLTEDIQVSLQKKQSIKLNAAMPDKPDEGTLFCLSGRLGSESYVKSSQWVYIMPYPPFMRPRNLKTTYLCKAAVGVEFSHNRTGNITLIDLNEGNDSAIGMPDLPNIFQVNNGNKHYKGGEVENLFLIQGGNITGLLEGGKGLNIIKLGNLISHDNFYPLLDKQMILCIKRTDALDYPCNKKGVQLKYIQHIYGRENKKDVIFISQDIQHIDGLAGKNDDEKDHIYLTRYSSENFWLMLRPYTVIHAFVPKQVLKKILIDYKLTPQNGRTLVQVDCNKSTYHRFNIEFSLTKLFVLSIIKNEIVLKFFYAKNSFELNIMAVLKSNSHCLSSQFSTIQFFFKNQEMTLLNENYLFIRDLSSRTIEELVAYYLPLTLRLQIIIQLYSVEKKLMLQMSHNQYTVLYNEPSLVKNYLISQGDKTIFLIKPPLKNIDSTNSEIVIYSAGKKSFSNTLDLRKVWHQSQKDCANHTILIDIVEEKKDLILSLKINYNRLLKNCISLESFRPFVTVKLHHALVNNSYRNLEILLYKVPYVIARNDQQNWYLEPYSLVFSHKKNLILLTKDDLLLGAEIVLFKRVNRGEFRFFCHQEKDLILTNAFDPRTQVDELCTVVYTQFYRDLKMRTLTLSSKLTLINQQIILQEQRKDIDSLPCSDISQANLTVIFNNFFNPKLKQSSDFLKDNRRCKRQTEIKNSRVENLNPLPSVNYPKSPIRSLVKSKRDSSSKISKVQIPLSTRANTLLSSFNDHFTDSDSNFFTRVDNDTEINGQSLFLSWMYHTLWGKKSKPLNFKKTFEMKYENQFHRAIEKFEKLQNESSYSWSRIVKK